MEELIPLNPNNETNPVSARLLHSYLENKDMFANWIKDRIAQYDFIENEDYIVYLENSKKGRPSEEYAITLEMAKELAMVERNSKGKRARKYFIECESKLKGKSISLPNYAQALRALADTVEEKELLQKQLKEAEPAVEFYNQVTDSTDAIDMGTVAKVLNMGIGRNEVFKRLRNMKILMKDNQPYQEYIDKGYFRVIESKYNKPDGSVNVSFKTVVYQKGLDFIRKRLLGYTDNLAA